MDDDAGPRQYAHTVRRHSATARVAIALLAQASALLVIPAQHRTSLQLSLVVTLVWGGVLMTVLRRAAPAWVLVVDTAVTGTFCLLQPVLEVPALVAADCGWVLMTTEVVVIALQWQFPRTPALGAAGVLALAFGAGGLLMHQQPTTTVLVISLWLMVTALVSSALAGSLATTDRRMAAAAAQHELSRREALVAGARSRARAEYLATLHDTVAATLLMVGTGATGGDREALRAQAGRDLAVLTRSAAPGPDLRRTLGEVARASGLDVTITGAGAGTGDHLPAAALAALTGATGEALRNVARHSGTVSATVRIEESDGVTRVEVRDHGVGLPSDFSPDRGITQSINGRMERCGGRASVDPGAPGVLVTLLWPAPESR